VWSFSPETISSGPRSGFHPPRGGLPCLVPAGLVTLPDVAGGGEDLAEVGPAIGGEACGAQRLEGEGLVVEQELHAKLLISWCTTSSVFRLCP
jgi:hypothetical protein